ncbi:helix-turn-helix domain-containing protein [Brevibacillus ruminantium]|uniref:Helix-turn-helix domain-containing protein n=1 Tax=Brevibacillus ruminantium TaxID=2950604 RepID=A0ABY4WF79_9BACL|nr:helix-turn-helix domain-containing protein [Brevibacillus ruminantium]USG63979.1 helix-turn-helix domain-containing protein [Brevibacillus ruminantium]
MSEKPYAKFAEKLVTLRKKANLTQSALADKIGISQASIAQYETGNRLPETPVLLDLSRLFEIDLNELVGNDKVLKTIKICPGCDYQFHKDHAKYCIQCGSKLLDECPECNNPLDSAIQLFCAYCGHKLREKRIDELNDDDLPF